MSVPRDRKDNLLLYTVSTFACAVTSFIVVIVITWFKLQLLVVIKLQALCVSRQNDDNILKRLKKTRR